MKKIQEIKVENKNVLVRIDSDVPVKDEQVTDDERLQASIPTLKYLLENGAKVTIIGHIGRPNSEEVTELKMRPVEDKLIELLGTHLNWQILENLRFNAGEEENNPEFTEHLIAGQDLFVQDAFATCHRNHASTVGVAKLLPSYAGMSVQKEVENLSKILESPVRPFIVIVGGAKIEDKKPVIDGLLPIADKILVGGVVANVLQKEKEQLSPKIVLPIDGLPKLTGFDIGPKTIALFKKIIESAKTIFWAGTMGKYENPEYSIGSKEIAEAIVASHAKKFAGGGDTTSFIRQNNLQDKFDFLSTGGGATLEYLSGKKLPGLEVLN